MAYDDSDEPAVRRLAERFVAIWNAHELQQLEEIYTADGDFVNVIGMRWKGARQVAQAHVQVHETRMRQTTLTSTGLTVCFLAPTVAVVHDTWVLTGDPGAPGWKFKEERRGILLHVMQKVAPHGWRIAASQNTEIQDMPNV